MDLNRRNFLFGSAAAAALAGCATTKKGVRTLKEGEKPTVAIIGYGLRARDLMREFLDLNDMCRVTAVCDCVGEHFFGFLILKPQRRVVIQHFKITEGADLQALRMSYWTTKIIKLALNCFLGYGLDQISACM